MGNIKVPTPNFEPEELMLVVKGSSGEELISQTLLPYYGAMLKAAERVDERHTIDATGKYAEWWVNQMVSGNSVDDLRCYNASMNYMVVVESKKQSISNNSEHAKENRKRKLRIFPDISVLGGTYRGSLGYAVTYTSGRSSDKRMIVDAKSKPREVYIKGLKSSPEAKHVGHSDINDRYMGDKFEVEGGSAFVGKTGTVMESEINAG